MTLTRRDVVQLAALVTGGTLVTTLLRMNRPIGVNVSGVPSADAVRSDRSSPLRNNPAADLSLIVFTDYRCPACRAAHPAMERAVAKDGRVRIIYKDWPIFGPLSERAAQVAIASDLQHIYPLVHDRLMTERANDDDALRAAVEGASGDWNRLQADLARDRSRIAAQLARNSWQAFTLGLGGTPGYLIGPILVRGALNEREFRRAFREAREQG
ncbi:thioredoxin domain-containing protein [Sphingomonas sp. MAH-20]|uniref:Thioredoxin domain-containing protein n=1 Tax=Sphingomonas horti TaxID=2682842 RepID=A0A6I4IWR5_9SPHN|nr:MULTISPECIES: thioredoxin domain-containing protein [Sphingomonas]MBA2920262.1 thioredoxin domain-containing protein [Sphingomonas sp. CGMCC 1.13658]MVO76516.1 thioredoxin domain-containing protein [Sphingomonas horti]